MPNPGTVLGPAVDDNYKVDSEVTQVEFDALQLKLVRQELAIQRLTVPGRPFRRRYMKVRYRLGRWLYSLAYRIS